MFLARRLALIVTSLGSSQRGGGAARALSQLANAWVAQGRTVSIFILAEAADRPCFPLDEAIGVTALGAPEIGGILERTIRVSRRVLQLRAVLKAFHPDVIVSFLAGPNVNAIAVGRSLGIPIVACERVDPFVHPLPRPYGALRTLAYPWADLIVVQTEEAASYFSSPSGRGKVTVIPNVVLPHPRPKDAHRDEANRLVTVGVLTAPKNHRALIEAVGRLRDDYPALTLTIYGEGSERTALMDLIRARGLEARVSMPGFAADVTDRLTDFDLFLFPSRHEGFPNALGEAMSAGLPVIASNASGNRTLVENGVNGRLVPVDDVTALAAAIAELHGARALREQLGKEARRLCERFTPERITDLWDQALGRVTDRSSFARIRH